MRGLVSATALSIALSAPAYADEDVASSIDDLIQQAMVYDQEAAKEAMSYRDLMLDFAPPADPAQSDIIRYLIEAWHLKFNIFRTQIATYDFDQDGNEDIFLLYPENFANSYIAAFKRNADNTVDHVGIIKAASMLRGFEKNKMTAMTSGNQQYSYFYDEIRGQFVFDFDSVGDDIQLFETEFVEVEGILARDMKSQALVMQSSSAENDRILHGEIDLNGDGYNEKLLSVRHVSVCKEDNSCPVFVYDRFDERPFYQFWSQSEEIYSETEIRPGSLRSLYFEYEGAPHSTRWNGEQGKYEVYELIY